MGSEMNSLGYKASLSYGLLAGIEHVVSGVSLLVQHLSLLVFQPHPPALAHLAPIFTNHPHHHFPHHHQLQA